MKSTSPIALFDSGVGGLTITKEIMKELPYEDILYFGDTARVPYGPRPQQEVESFVLGIIDYLVNEVKAKMVIIACNTATAAGLKAAQEKFEVPIIGTPVKQGAEAAINQTSKQKIGVIATEGTIKSRLYQREIEKISNEVEIFTQPCPEFVTLVESGRIEGEEVEEEVKNTLTPLQLMGVDTLILGCTHFPYLSKVIQKVMGPDFNIINAGRQTALQTREILLNNDNLVQSERDSKKGFYVSDLDKVSTEFIEVGREYLEIKELEFKEISILDKIASY